MNQRITIRRLVEQYTDVVVPDVENAEQAAEYVAKQLESDVDRARLLRGQSWFGDNAREYEIVGVADHP